MASVWIETERGARREHCGLDGLTARVVMEQYAAAWLRRHRSAGMARISELEVHLLQHGRPVKHVYVEMMTPPTVPTGGDRYRQRTTGA